MTTSAQSIKHISKVNQLPTGIQIKPNFIYLKQTPEGFSIHVSSNNGDNIRNLDVGLRIFNSKNERIY